MEEKRGFIDFDYIRANYDLKAYMISQLGRPVAESNETGNSTWKCIFHNEKHDPGRDLKHFTGKDGIQRFQCQSANCEAKGDILDFVRLHHGLPDNLEAARQLTGEEIETRHHQTPPTKKQQQTFNSLLPVVEQYHTSMNGHSQLWRDKGIQSPTTKHFRLGYCPQCPTYHQSDSLTIPYFYADDIVDVKHRLLSPNGSGKYRHHKTGMRNRLFYPQGLFPQQDETGFTLSRNNEAILLEGEIKTMVLWQIGYRCSGIPGATNWQESWLRFFKHLKKVYICLDMDVEEEYLNRIIFSLKEIGAEVVRVCLPVNKPDDFFVKFGGTIEEFEYYLSYGRLI